MDDESKVTMTIGASIILKNMIDAILNTKEKVGDTEVDTPRALPFRLSYRLNKNLMILEKDVEAFEEAKLKVLAEYAELSEDEAKVEIKDPEKVKKYNNAINNMLSYRVTHELRKLEPEDLERIDREDLKFSSDAMKLFIGYMTNDDNLLKEIETRLNFNNIIDNTEQEK